MGLEEESSLLLCFPDTMVKFKLWSKMTASFNFRLRLLKLKILKLMRKERIYVEKYCGWPVLWKRNCLSK